MFGWFHFFQSKELQTKKQTNKQKQKKKQNKTKQNKTKQKKTKQKMKTKTKTKQNKIIPYSRLKIDDVIMIPIKIELIERYLYVHGMTWRFYSTDHRNKSHTQKWLGNRTTF